MVSELPHPTANEGSRGRAIAGGDEIDDGDWALEGGRGYDSAGRTRSHETYGTEESGSLEVKQHLQGWFQRQDTDLVLGSQCGKVERVCGVLN